MGKIYIVRDSAPLGNLCGWVCVWEEKPARYPILCGWGWLSAYLPHPMRGWVETLLVGDAERKYGTVPDNDREMIVLRRKLK